MAIHLRSSKTLSFHEIQPLHCHVILMEQEMGSQLYTSSVGQIFTLGNNCRDHQNPKITHYQLPRFQESICEYLGIPDRFTARQ